MDFTQILFNWLIARMGWVYGFVVHTLGLPSFFGYLIIILLIVVFFYDLVDIFMHREATSTALLWLACVLIVPLGTVIYLAFGRRYVHKAYLLAKEKQNGFH